MKAMLGAGPRPGASNLIHSPRFTCERMAAQRWKVIPMEPHSTWVAEPGRVLGSSQGYGHLPGL